MGSINHELKIRGAKQLKAASSSHVKSKGLGLIVDFGKKVDKKFTKMTEKGKMFLAYWSSGRRNNRS